MTYRSGNYIAFDGLGETDPTKSDFKYYATIKAWASNKKFDFKYVNSHDKTYAVRDSSLKATLKRRICARLANSKNIIVILSAETRKKGSMLSYEIEQAVNTYHLPLICAYIDFYKIMAPSKLSSRWPDTLEECINNKTARAIHIPFKKGALLNAITNQTVFNNTLTNGLHYYTYDAHIQLGCFKRRLKTHTSSTIIL